MFTFTSKTEIPTADAKGLPPKVLKIEACVRHSAISEVVTTAAKGKPLPIPMANFLLIKKFVRKTNSLFQTFCHGDNVG